MMQPAFAASFVAALTEIRNAKKDADNTFHKSRYSTLAAVLESTKEALSKHGLAVMQNPGAIDANGNLELNTVIIHSSGEWYCNTSQIPLKDKTPQGYGSALTYGRRYALMSMLGISAVEDDDDGERAQGREKPEPPPALDVVWNEGEAASGVPVHLFSETVRRVADFGEKAIPGYKKALLDRNKQTLRTYWKLDKAAAESLHAYLEGKVS